MMVTEDWIYKRKMDGYSINSPILAIIVANQYLYLPQHILYYRYVFFSRFSLCFFFILLFFTVFFFFLANYHMCLPRTCRALSGSTILLLFTRHVRAQI